MEVFERVPNLCYIDLTSLSPPPLFQTVSSEFHYALHVYLHIDKYNVLWCPLNHQYSLLSPFPPIESPRQTPFCIHVPVLLLFSSF